MEIDRGTVMDRPWGMTLGALGARRCTGQLTLVDPQGRSYCVAFDHGAVVGASSPLPGDSAVRIASVNQLVATNLLPEIARRIAASPDRDDVEIVAETARLSIDQA